MCFLDFKNDIYIVGSILYSAEWENLTHGVRDSSKQGYMDTDVLVKSRWRFSYFLSKLSNKQTHKLGQVDTSNITTEQNF